MSQAPICDTLLLCSGGLCLLSPVPCSYILLDSLDRSEIPWPDVLPDIFYQDYVVVKGCRKENTKARTIFIMYQDTYRQRGRRLLGSFTRRPRSGPSVYRTLFATVTMHCAQSGP